LRKSIENVSTTPAGVDPLFFLPGGVAALNPRLFPRFGMSRKRGVVRRDIRKRMLQRSSFGKPMKRLLIAVVALVAMMVLSACNTVRGMGQDIRSVGTGIERASNN